MNKQKNLSTFSNEFKQSPQEKRVCTSCGTSTTPLWRRNDKSELVCNACGLYIKANKQKRPNWLKNKAVKENKYSDEFISDFSKEKGQNGTLIFHWVNKGFSHLTSKSTLPVNSASGEHNNFPLFENKKSSHSLVEPVFQKNHDAACNKNIPIIRPVKLGNPLNLPALENTTQNRFDKIDEFHLEKYETNKIERFANVKNHVLDHMDISEQSCMEKTTMPFSMISDDEKSPKWHRHHLMFDSSLPLVSSVESSNLKRLSQSFSIDEQKSSTKRVRTNPMAIVNLMD